MTPKQALLTLEKQHPESVFEDAYFVHDGLWMFFSRPKEAKKETSIGQVYFCDPSTGKTGPYAPCGAGKKEFDRWCESASKLLPLRGNKVNNIIQNSLGSIGQ